MAEISFRSSDDNGVPLSDVLDGQGDVEQGWSQSSSAVPHALSQSSNSTAQSSFSAPNRPGGQPYFLHGKGVRLSSLFAQSGRVTSVETDGDVSDFQVDDVFARLNRQVSMPPLATGFGWGAFLGQSYARNSSGNLGVNSPLTSLDIAADGAGIIFRGMTQTDIAGNVLDAPATSNTPWSSTSIVRKVATSTYVQSDDVYLTRAGTSGYILYKMSRGSTIPVTSLATPGNAVISSIAVYRDQYIFVTTNSGKVYRTTPALTEFTEYSISGTTHGTEHCIVCVNEKNGDVNLSWATYVQISGKSAYTIITENASTTGVFRGRLYTQTDFYDWNADQNTTLLTGSTMLGNGDIAILAREQTYTPNDTNSGYTAMYPRTARFYIAGVAGSIFSIENGGWSTGISYHSPTDTILISQVDGYTEYPTVEGDPSTTYTARTLRYVGTSPNVLGALNAYAGRAGTSVSFTGSGDSLPAAYPEWDGNLLDSVYEIATINRFNLSAGNHDGEIVVSSILDTSLKDMPDPVDSMPSLTLGTDGAVDSYTIQSNRSRIVRPGEEELAFSLASSGEDISFSSNSQYTFTFQVDHSLTDVMPPISNPSATPVEEYNSYMVEDSNGQDVTLNFKAYGGDVSFDISPDDPHTIIVYVNAPSQNFWATPLTGMDDPTDSYSLSYKGQPFLNIKGSGIFQYPKTVKIYTGSDPDFTRAETGPNYTSPFLDTITRAYDAANMISVNTVTPSIELDTEVHVTSARNVGFRGGERVHYGDANYRIMSVNGDTADARWSLAQYTTVGEHNAEWLGATVGQHDEILAGRTGADMHVAPLYSGDFVSIKPGAILYINIDTDGRAYWTTTPDGEATVLLDEDGSPYWAEPEGQPGAVPVILDTDSTPYLEM